MAAEELARSNHRSPRILRGPRASASPRAALYAAPRRDESFDELARKRRDTAHFRRELEEDARECTFKPEAFASPRPAGDACLADRAAAREELRGRRAQQALARFLQEHPFRPNPARVVSAEQPAPAHNPRRLSERLHGDAQAREASRRRRDAAERAKLFRPEINERSKQLVQEARPARGEKLSKAHYDAREHVDYFVVQDTPRKICPPRADRHKRTANTQDTLGRRSSALDPDREDSPGSLGSSREPPVRAFEPTGQYSVRVPDHDFVSFYDEDELPGPKQSVLPKQSALSQHSAEQSPKKSQATVPLTAPQPAPQQQPAQQRQQGQRNTFFESQEDSREQAETSSPDRSPTEKKKTNQFVSELVGEAARSPESKKESVIINHIIKRDEDKPSAGFFLLKFVGDPQEPHEEAPTGLRTPRRSFE